MDFKTLRNILALIFFFMSDYSCNILQSVDIPAYEYIKRFNNDLQLGQCPNRLVADHGQTAVETCQLRRRNGQTIPANRMVSSSKVMHIMNPQKLIFHIGLCDGDAAKYFGLLEGNNDCAATEIARKLSFGRKSAVRMLVDHFRPRIDILIPSQDHEIPSEFSHYGWDKYYVSNIGIGTQEVIVVELQFSNRLLAEKARSFEHTHLLSRYVREVTRRIGVPKRIKVVRLSTANMVLQHNVFKGHTAVDTVMKLLQFYEDQIEQTREDITYGRKVAHLRYGLKQYETGPIASRLSTVSMKTLRESWENITLLEVTTNRLYISYKRFRRFCKNSMISNPVCKRIQNTLSDLKSALSCIHDKRSSWSSDNFDEQQEYTKRMKRVVKAIRLKLKMESKIIKRILKQVKV